MKSWYLNDRLHLYIPISISNDYWVILTDKIASGIFYLLVCSYIRHKTFKAYLSASKVPKIGWKVLKITLKLFGLSRYTNSNGKSFKRNKCLGHKIGKNLLLLEGKIFNQGGTHNFYDVQYFIHLLQDLFSSHL